VSGGKNTFRRSAQIILVSYDVALLISKTHPYNMNQQDALFAINLFQ